MKVGNHMSTITSSNPLKISDEQKNFLITGTYEILSNFGSSFFRKLQVIGQDPDSGKVLVKETYSGNHPYNKLFVLSPEGRSEKYRGQLFQNV